MRCCVNESGDVFMCSHQQIPIGNLFLKTFDEVWMSESAEAIREDARSERLHPQCCTSTCPYRSKVFKNRQIGFNEHPSYLEIAPSVRLAPRMKYVLPNLFNLEIIGEPDETELLSFLDALEFEQYRNQITVISKAKMLTKKFTEKVSKSVITFQLNRFDRRIEELSVYKKHCKGQHRIRIQFNVGREGVEEYKQILKFCKDIGAEVLLHPDSSLTEEDCGFFIQAQFDITEECWRLQLPHQILKPLDSLAENLVYFS